MRCDDLRFLHGASFPRYRYTIDKQYNNYYGLQFMRQGRIRVAYGVQEQLLEGAWVWPTFPGMRIRFGPAEETDWWEHRYIAFVGPLVNHWQADGLWPRGAQMVADAESVATRFDLMLSLFKRQDHFGILRGINLLEQLLLELADERRQPEQHERWLREILEALEPGSSGTPTITALAGRVGMAPSTLRRRFKQATGMGVNAWVLSRRIAAACQLLGDSRLSIGQIAQRLGYGDIYFFSRQFRQRTGLTPSAYRASRL